MRSSWGRESGSRPPRPSQRCWTARVLEAGNVRLEEISNATRSLALRGRVEADASCAGIQASSARWDFAITLRRSQRAARTNERSGMGEAPRVCACGSGHMRARAGGLWCGSASWKGVVARIETAESAVFMAMPAAAVGVDGKGAKLRLADALMGKGSSDPWSSRSAAAGFGSDHQIRNAVSAPLVSTHPSHPSHPSLITRWPPPPAFVLVQCRGRTMASNGFHNSHHCAQRRQP